MRRKLALSAALIFLCTGTAVAGPVGFTLQAYPAGTMVEAEAVFPLQAHHSLFFRAGYNFTDRRDYGEHENEEGGGPGATVGYRFTPRDSMDGWFFGARADLWFLNIDWQDPGRSGSTDIIVLQPTVEAGYRFRFADGWSISPFLGLGLEINEHTDGEDVGEGAILLGGVSLTKAFR